MKARGKTITRSWVALLAIASTLFISSPRLPAADMDASIELSAEKTDEFKIKLKEVSIEVESRNGIVSLSGTVADTSHKALAQDTVEGIPGVTRVDNQLKVRGEGPAEHSD